MSPKESKNPAPPEPEMSPGESPEESKDPAPSAAARAAIRAAVRGATRAAARAARAKLCRLRAELADLGDGGWLSCWLEEPRPGAPLEEITFLVVATARRLAIVRGRHPSESKDEGPEFADGEPDTASEVSGSDENGGAAGSDEKCGDGGNGGNGGNGGK